MIKSKKKEIYKKIFACLLAKIPEGEGERRLQRESKYERLYLILHDMRLFATMLTRLRQGQRKKETSKIKSRTQNNVTKDFSSGLLTWLLDASASAGSLS